MASALSLPCRRQSSTFGQIGGQTQLRSTPIGLFLALAVTAVHQCPADQQADEIRRSISQGVQYLIGMQSADGTWSSSGHVLGETALAGLALIAGGQDPNSPRVVAAAEAVRRLAATDTNTYDNSLAIMFLDRLGVPSDADLLRRLGARLAEGQCASGAWTYDVASGRGLGGDNSNTQFAALAAWVSRRHGVVNDAGLQRLDQYFRGSFDEASGGWGYSGRVGATPTMTCAGLVGIAIHRGAEQQRVSGGRPSDTSHRGRPQAKGRAPKNAADDPMAARALAALGRELRLAERDSAAPLNSDLYFFWSLERVAVIYDLREIGGVDWYRWGAKRLVRGQSPNGEWRGTSCTKRWPFEESVGTSFGILFLSRANVAFDLTAEVGSGGGVGEAPPGLGGGSQLIRRGDPEEAPPPLPASAPPARTRQPSPKKTAPKPTIGPGVLDP